MLSKRKLKKKGLLKPLTSISLRDILILNTTWKQYSKKITNGSVKLISKNLLEVELIGSYIKIIAYKNNKNNFYKTNNNNIKSSSFFIVIKKSQDTLHVIPIDNEFNEQYEKKNFNYEFNILKFELKYLIFSLFLPIIDKKININIEKLDQNDDEIDENEIVEQEDDVIVEKEVIDDKFAKQNNDEDIQIEDDNYIKKNDEIDETEESEEYKLLKEQEQIDLINNNENNDENINESEQSLSTTSSLTSLSSYLHPIFLPKCSSVLIHYGEYHRPIKKFQFKK